MPAITKRCLEGGGKPFRLGLTKVKRRCVPWGGSGRHTFRREKGSA